MSVTIQAAKQGYYARTLPLTLTAGENRCPLTLPRLPTNNLLDNGDFEKGFPAARSMEHGTTGKRGAWSFRFSPGVGCYIYPESIYGWRKPHIFRGKEAISHVTDGGGEIQLSQDVVVDPNATLTGSVWVQGLDVQGNGQGFGAGPRDFAGFWIQELDAAGAIVKQHEKVGIGKATSDFQRLRLTFTTTPKTAKVRFVLRSAIQCNWQHGAALYDECALEVSPAPKRIKTN